MPLSTGMRAKNALKASIPPAEAPRPTTRWVRSGEGSPAIALGPRPRDPILSSGLVLRLPDRLGLAATLPHPERHPSFAAVAALYIDQRSVGRLVARGLRNPYRQAPNPRLAAALRQRTLPPCQRRLPPRRWRRETLLHRRRKTFARARAQRRRARPACWRRWAHARSADGEISRRRGTRTDTREEATRDYLPKEQALLRLACGVRSCAIFDAPTRRH